MTRAKKAFKNCNYSVGLESGLIRVSNTKTGYMDTCVCAFYDGKKFHLGMSPCFEMPIKVTKLVFKKKYDINEAFFEEKLTNNSKIGSKEGAIGILTKGRVTRMDYTKMAIMMALIHLENKELY